MINIISFAIIAILLITDGINKGMSIGGILAYIPMGISVFIAIFSDDTNTSLIAAVVTGILTFVFTHNFVFSLMIASFLIMHAIFIVDR